jgi:hypothetical protein
MYHIGKKLKGRLEDLGRRAGSPSAPPVSLQDFPEGQDHSSATPKEYTSYDAAERDVEPLILGLDASKGDCHASPSERKEQN